MVNYGVLLGSNVFIGTNGILKVPINDTLKEFFRIREIYNFRSDGSYLSVECDIKDKDNNREIKLFKNRDVHSDMYDQIKVDYSDTQTHVTRSDGSTVIKIEQLEIDDNRLSKTTRTIISFLLSQVASKIEALVRITGEFYAGPYYVKIDNQIMEIGGISMESCANVGGQAGITIAPDGFRF